MFEIDDEKRLLRLMSRNDVILFLGSGFSHNVKNRLSEYFPTGNKLAEEIWKFIDLKGDYDNTSLTEMYLAFLHSKKKKIDKKSFLDDHLLSSNNGVPDYYDSISLPFWYKIYTLNIDDVLEKIFLRTNKRFEILQYPKHEYKERDQSLEKTQIVHLNGRLPEEPENLIFSNNQYAKATLSHQPLYGQFVYDYAVKTTIFVGTDLNEPIFESYLEARENRFKVKERRPKSYLISPNLSQVKQLNFKERYNVHYIKGTTQDFLEWIMKNSDQLPTKDEILQVTFPKLVQMLNVSDLQYEDKKALTIFTEGFEKVPSDHKITSNRSGFLMGTTPVWNDIFKDLDIGRTITEQIFNDVDVYLRQNENLPIKIINLLGTAGSGKSTILKRLGLKLSQEGHTAFLSYTDHIPNFHQIFNALNIIKSKSVLMIDNAENYIVNLPKLVTTLNQLDYPPVILLASRMSSYVKAKNIISDETDYSVVVLPDLDDQEITDLIEKLDANNLLGILKGYTPQNRFMAVKHHAKKQILIALKEATFGKNFNEIIKDEYDKIEPHEAKILCTCVALNTEIGFANSKQDFVGFSKVQHSEALDYLENTLFGTIMWVGNGERFMVRHRILADYIIKQCTDLGTLKEAYIRVLSILAPELKNSSASNNKFKLYKSLINHQNLYTRFHENIEHAREVYDSVSEFFNDSFQYWLQYGCLELEGSKGSLELAENYLNQAESLYSKNMYIQNAKASLYYKKSIQDIDYTIAIQYKNQADGVANSLFALSGNGNPYIYHIYCNGRFNFMRKWIDNRADKVLEHKHLIKKAENAMTLYPHDTRIEDLHRQLTRSFLTLSSSGDILNVEISTGLE